MTVTAPLPQLTLNLEPSVVDRWPTLRQFIAHRLDVQVKPAKTIAAEMDIAPSTLSRKLHPSEGDTQRFNVDDLERYLEKTGDAAAVVEYLAAKFLSGGDEARKARLIAGAERAMRELTASIAAMKGEGPR